MKLSDVQRLSKVRTISNAEIMELIDLYRSSTEPEREIIRMNVNADISWQLLSFGRSAAVNCVREQSKNVLVAGLLSQAIADIKEDWRDNLSTLFLLYYSARRIGENPRLMMKDLIKLSSKKFGKLLYEFLGRDDLDEDLVKLCGYKVVEKPMFDYVWNQANA